MSAVADAGDQIVDVVERLTICVPPEPRFESILVSSSERVCGRVVDGADVVELPLIVEVSAK